MMTPLNNWLIVVCCASLAKWSYGFVITTRSTAQQQWKSAGIELPLQTTIGLRSTTGTSSKTESSKTSPAVEDQGNEVPSAVGNVMLVLPSTASQTVSKFGGKSPVPNPSLWDASQHLMNKMAWFSNGKIKAETTILDQDLKADTAVKTRLQNANVVIAMGLSLEKDLEYISQMFQSRRQQQNDGKLLSRQCQFALDCSFPSTSNDDADPGALSPKVGPFDCQSPSFASRVAPWSLDASGSRFMNQMQGLFDRWTSDDFCLAIMLFFHTFVSPIDWVKYSIDATWEKGPVQNAVEFYRMISKCGDCITKCLADENCRACIDALNAVDTRDQVASYRTVVSYESDLLRDFSYCILQRNNIFGCQSQIPKNRPPGIVPPTHWREKALTHDVAQQLLMGHLRPDEMTCMSPALEGSMELDISWKVAAGANVAYDQFPSQNQIFYKGVGRNVMWYDPVFRVETIDGRNVWCKRHYRVGNGKVPGTFRLSVLDNGVVSNEFWTIVGVADDLSWIVFHYAGAASAVGQQYIGGLVCTADGSLPPVEQQDRVWETLQSAGIQPWEMFVVDNDPNSAGAIDAGPAPLRFYRDQVIAEKKAKET